jgi:hypothetical protein
MFTRTALTTASLLVMLSACSSAASPDSASPSAEEPAHGGAPAAGSKGGGAANAAGNTAGGAVLDLGNVAAGAPITFEVPAGTVGFTIVVDAMPSASDSIGVQELTDPMGAVLVTDFGDPSATGRITRGDNGTGLGVVSVPLVNDQATTAVRAGRWTARLGGLTSAAKGMKGDSTPYSGQVHAVVHLQTSSDGAFHGGAIDLDLYVPDGLQVENDSGAAHSITAATAAADVDLQARLTLVFGLFHRLYGLDRGDVRYHAVATGVATLASQDEIDAANQLATSAVRERPAPQVILTNHLSPDGDGTEISGISNCLPGAVGVAGSKCSAVVVSLRAGSPAWEDASTFVHELGHFAGLDHTTQFGGDPDTLGDTPVCTNTAKSALTSCPDKDNLMFPTVNLATDEPSIVVSPSQRAVFLGSSLYRPLAP